jgi:hypothetical protein
MLAPYRNSLDRLDTGRRDDEFNGSYRGAGGTRQEQSPSNSVYCTTSALGNVDSKYLIVFDYSICMINKLRKAGCEKKVVLGATKLVVSLRQPTPHSHNVSTAPIKRQAQEKEIISYKTRQSLECSIEANLLPFTFPYSACSSTT